MKYLFSFALRGGLLGALWFGLALAGPVARAQAPAWQSAMVVGGSNSNLSIKTTATSPSGDLYVAGGFSGLVTIGNNTLASIGSVDGFIAKWSPATNSFLWSYSFGGSDIDQVTALVLSGNRVYLAGFFFSPTASFGNYDVYNAGGRNFIGADAFVARLTDTGNSASFGWAQQLGGLGEDAATALVATGTSLYVGGSFASTTATFGSISLANSTAGSGTTSPDGFVAKLVDAAPTPSTSWVQPVTGPSAKYVNALALSGTSVYATGYFRGAAANFGSTALPNASTTANVYVAKLADTGPTSAWQWALQAGGTSYDVGNALAVNGSRVYVAGSFSSTTMALGPFTVANSGAGGSTTDAFVAAVTDAGATAAWAWAQAAGGTANDQGTVLTTSGTNGVYLAGAFASSAVSIGSTAVAATTGCALVARLTDAGNSATVDWAQRGGAANNTEASCMALAGARLFMAGSFQTTATFGTQTLASSPLGPSTNYLVSLTDHTLLATMPGVLSGMAFSLYPNPAHRTTTVLLPALPGITTAVLTLTDALGRAVHTTTVALPSAGLRHTLDLTSLAPGLYALRVRAGSTSGTQRLVVE